MQNSVIRNGIILGVFALICTALVAIVNELTKPTIKEQQRLQLTSILSQIVPANLHDNDLTAHCTLLQDEEALGTDQPLPAYIATNNDKAVAVVIEAVAPNGYNGAIKFVVGINLDGTVLGVRTLSHNETPGLGDKIEIKKSDWVDSFIGKKLTDENASSWQVKKDGGEIDQFTGATITPRAYTNALRSTIAYFNANKRTIISQPLNCEVNQ